MQRCSPSLSRLVLVLGVGATATDTVAAEPLRLEDAVATGLDRSPAIASARARRAQSSGQATNLQGSFDWVVDANASYARLDGELSSAQDIEDQVLTLGLGLSKQLDYGLLLRPFVNGARRETLISGPGGLDGQRFAGIFGLEVSQPLLRGRGALGAPAAAAALREQAAELDLRAARGIVLREVGQAYWAFRAALETRAILAEAEALSAGLLETTRQLVQAQQRPAAELDQLEATLADRQRARIEASLSVIESSTVLALAMGLGLEELETWEEATTPFPMRRPMAPRSELRKRTLATRPEIAAARARVEAAATELEGAENGTLPALDLSASAAYTLVDDNDGQSLIAPLGASTPGVTADVRLDLELPIENRAQQGAADAFAAERLAAEIQLRDVERRALIGTDLAAQRVEILARAAERAERAVRAHERALRNAERRVAAGLSTLLDVTIFQDRLIAAKTVLVSLSARYASALVDVAFVTGRLGLVEDEADVLDAFEARR